MAELDFRLILEAFSDAVVASNRSNRIIYVNAAVQKLLGWSREELIGQPLTSLMPERMRAAHEAGFRRYTQTHQAKLIGRPVRVPALHRDGHEVDIELTLSAFTLGPEEELFIGSLRDVRDRVELERQLLAHGRVQVQYEVMRVLAEARTLTDAAPRLLSAIAERLAWDVAIFWSRERHGGRLHVFSSWARDPQAVKRFLDTSWSLSFDSGEGLPGTVWRSAQPLSIIDVARDERYARRAVALADGLHGAFFFPVIGPTRVHGLLEFLAREPREPDEELLQAMAALGFQIGQFVERLAAEDELRASREWLATTLSSIGDAVIATEDDGRVAFINPIAQHLTGCRESEAVGKPLAEVFRIIDERTRAPAASPVERVLRAGEIVELPGRTLLLSRDGTEYAIEDSAAPIRTADGQLRGVVLVFRDATEKRRAEDATRFLSEASAVLGGSLDYAVTMERIAQLVVPKLAECCVIDILRDEPGAPTELIVAHVDPAKNELIREIRRRLPLDPESGVLRVLHTGEPELIPQVPHDLLASRAPDARTLELVERVGLHSLMIVPLIARGRTLGAMTFVRSRAGSPYGPADLAFAQELAHRAAQAVENARLYDEAQEAIRVRDDFLSIASHELKTPLTPLSLHLQSMQRADAAEVPPAMSKRLETMARQVSRLEKLVSSLLDVSRIAKGQLHLDREEVDLTALVHEVAARFQAVATQSRTPLIVTAPEPIVGFWDRLRLDQILTNLVSNALKFGAGKRVEITVERHDAVAQVSVRDRGIGIAPENQARIFERFERAVASRHYGGFGLGLWITRQIVEALGGSIRVDSELGQGSTFTVELPLKVADAQSDATRAER